MKKVNLLLIASVFLFACNSNNKSTVEKADSTNDAKRDTSYTGTVADDASSSFLVRVIDGGMAEVDIANYAKKSSNAEVSSFAGMLYDAHTGVNNQVKALASQKNITLPDSMSAEKRKDLDDLKAKKGKDFDRAFIDKMISNHEKGISMFNDAIRDAKDPDVVSFAQATVPALQTHLDKAKEIRKKL